MERDRCLLRDRAEEGQDGKGGVELQESKTVGRKNPVLISLSVMPSSPDPQTTFDLPSTLASTQPTELNTEGMPEVKSEACGLLAGKFSRAQSFWPARRNRDRGI